MFHIYFCEGKALPEAIVFRREGRFDVKWGYVGVMIEDFLRVRASEEQSFVDFRARWKADSLLEEEVMENFLEDQKHPSRDRVFMPSGLTSVSGLTDDDWESFRHRIETDIWLFADADERPPTNEVRLELMRWLRGDFVRWRPHDRTAETFDAYIRSFQGSKIKAERRILAQFIRRLIPLKTRRPLERLQSYLTMPFDPVQPDRSIEWRLADSMSKELETDIDGLKNLLEIPHSQIPIWGYPAGSLLSPCIVELAYCVEHNIKFRRCQSPGCVTWFALADSRSAKDCHRCRSLDPTLRWRARKRAEGSAEFKLQWAWHRSNERRVKRGQERISLAEYRNTYKPRSAN